MKIALYITIPFLVLRSSFSSFQTYVVILVTYSHD